MIETKIVKTGEVESSFPKLMIGPVNNILLATGKTLDGDYTGMIIHDEGGAITEGGVGCYCGEVGDASWSRKSFKDFHGEVTLSNKTVEG